MTSIDKKLDEMVEIARMIHERLPNAREAMEKCPIDWDAPVPPELCFPMDIVYDSKSKFLRNDR